MSIIEQRRAQIFPQLSPAQREEAARFAAAPPLNFAPNERLFAAGERNVPAFLVLEGSVTVDGGGEVGAHPITEHGPGEIVGELNQLAGRAALVNGVAGPQGCSVLPFDAAHLRALIVGSAELGEIVMRAFILRRTALIAEGGAGSVLIGHATDPALVRVQGFLARNGYPQLVLDPAETSEGHALVERLGIAESDLPILLTPGGGAVLRRPSEAEIGAALGITPELDRDALHDVAVVGAGPAGLATAVYAASEGLSVVVLDARAFGGQAGASARIENYLGFPTGITGQALMARAFSQAQKFGAEIAIPLEVASFDCGGPDREPATPFRLILSDGAAVRARAVVIASGARYRRPDIAGIDEFEGAGVSYWASPVEAKLCGGEEVALIGAGNSAGQAVVYLAPRVKRLHLVVRGAGLEASMSRYLIDRIHALPNVELHTRTEIMEIGGDPARGLERASFRNRDTGAVWTGPLRHLFLFIGADPNTGWLKGCSIEVDDKGFVVTGKGGASPLATNVPGVFAIGDVRAGSTKRVAAAVGEGAQVVAALHGVLG